MNNKNKTLLVFTGGGVAPALNASLYGVITQARQEGMEILGGMFGWSCLLDKGKIVNLTSLNIEPIKDSGGTFLRSSRTNPFKIKDGIQQIQERINKLGIDYIVAIGGNDTLGAAKRLFEDYKIPLVGIPKTIDNDLSETYWTPGFPSAAHYLSEYTAQIRKDAAYAVRRIFIIEVMGGKAGWITASSAYGDADVIIPPEKKIDLDLVLKLIKERYQANGSFAVIVVSQEANLGERICSYEKMPTDQYGVKRREFICIDLKTEIQKQLGIETAAVVPGHYLSAGLPIEIDKKFSMLLGQKAVELLAEAKIGYMSSLKRPDVKRREIRVTETPLALVVKKYRKLDDTYFDFEKLQVKQKFLDYMEPILGKYKPKDEEYYKLIKSLAKKKGL